MKRNSTNNNELTIYKDLAELLPQTVFEVNTEGILTFGNKSGLKMFGYTIEDFDKGLNVLNLIIPADRERAVKRIALILSGEKTDGSEFTALRKDGSTFPFMIYSSPIVKQQKITGMRGIIIDITERKRAEADFKDLARRNETILQTAADGFQIINEDGKILQVNPAFCKMTGFTESELLLSNIEELQQSGNDSLLNKIKIVLNERNSLLEIRLKCKNNTLIDAEINANSMHLENEVLLFLAFRNTTERKVNEQKIRQLSRAVEQSPVSIVITDINGVIEYVNTKFCEITGYSFQEAIGNRPSILKSGEQDSEYYKNLWKTITGDKEWRGEFHNKKKNGDLFWEIASISPIKNSNGVTTHYLAVKEDITKRKLVEKELKEAKEKAEESSRLKSNFLANMSHELRTPLIGILGFAEILFDELLNPEQKEMANTIFLSGQRLLESLNMILDLSRLESDKFEFHFEPVNISKAVQESVNIFSSAVRNKKLEFSLALKDAEITSRVDENILNQVIKNLLNNAIKFTNSGSITVEVSSENSSSGCFSIIKIIDTGIGIATDEQKIIFEEFRQVKEGFNRPYEGAGIGLTLTKKFVELMGGKISLQSEKGRGSTFIVRFPSLKQIHSVTYSEPADDSSIYTRPKVLSVENDLSSVKIIKYFLKNLCVVEHAENGEHALRMIEKNRYKAILMDISLGTGISGIDAIKEIKRFPHCNDIPIVAVTSYAFPSDREKFLKSGCSHYLSKPFDRKTIVDLITEILDN